MDATRYRRRIGELVARSFPVLQGKRFLVRYFPFKSSYAAAFWLLPPLRVILLNPKCDRLDDLSLDALLAHELCHHEASAQDGWLRYVLTKPFIYLFSRAGEMREEMATDRLTIEKGYGRGLYALTDVLEHDPEHKRLNQYYLTKEQIREYAQEIGKW
jgi:hypothetical protein